MNVAPCTFAELDGDDNFAPLLLEYAAESGNKELPPPKIQTETYYKLEELGLLHMIAARTGGNGQLVGFIFVLVSVNPHYSARLAMSESFFVSSAHRMTGAGVRLLHAALDKAAELGAIGLYVNAPFGGSLFEVLPRLGFVESNRVFFMRIHQSG